MIRWPSNCKIFSFHSPQELRVGLKACAFMRLIFHARNMKTFSSNCWTRGPVEEAECSDENFFVTASFLWDVVCSLSGIDPGSMIGSFTRNSPLFWGGKRVRSTIPNIFLYCKSN